MNQNPELNEEKAPARGGFWPTTRSWVTGIWQALSAGLGWLFQPPSLMQLGWGYRSFVNAILLTAIFLICWNVVACWYVSRAVQSATLPEIEQATEPEERVSTALKLMQADPKIQNWIKQNLAQQESPRSAQQQLLDMMSDVGGSAGKEERIALVRDYFRGQQGGLWPLYVTVRSSSGDAVIERMGQTDGGKWGKRLQLSEHSQAKRLFLIQFADQLLAETQPKLRWISLINGPIQSLTLFLGFLCLGLIVRRGRLILRLRHLEGEVANQSGPATTQPAEAEWRELRHRYSTEHSARAHQSSQADEITSLTKEIDRRIYSPLAGLLGLIPSLGFLGTVWGMGTALLKTEGLFGQQNKRAVIGSITRDLGYAFDTTLVALGASIILGIVVLSLHAYEQGLWRTLLPSTSLNQKSAPRK